MQTAEWTDMLINGGSRMNDDEKWMLEALPIILDETYLPGKWEVTYHYDMPVEIKCSKDIYNHLKNTLEEKK